MGVSWRRDETYIKVNGQWKTLYRAVAKGGKTIELMHMIRTGQMAMPGCEGLSFADQFYALAGQVRPA